MKILQIFLVIFITYFMVCEAHSRKRYIIGFKSEDSMPNAKSMIMETARTMSYDDSDVDVEYSVGAVKGVITYIPGKKKCQRYARNNFFF
jgi:hypothetical protein